MLQGTIHSYDEKTGAGLIWDDARTEYAFDRESFRHTGIRLFRLGQRVKFRVEGEGRRRRIVDLTILTMEHVPPP